MAKSLKELMAAKAAAKAAKRNPVPVGRCPEEPYSNDVKKLLAYPFLKAPVLLPYTDCGEGYSPSACHLSTKHRVMKYGGSRVHGWAIWQFQDTALAEFHSVWRDENGNLFDITPHKFGEEYILFVEDPHLTITHSDGLNVLYSDRSPVDGVYFLKGNQTDSAMWTLDTRPLKDDFETLGFPDTSLAD